MAFRIFSPIRTRRSRTPAFQLNPCPPAHVSPRGISHIHLSTFTLLHFLTASSSLPLTLPLNLFILGNEVMRNRVTGYLPYRNQLILQQDPQV